MTAHEIEDALARIRARIHATLAAAPAGFPHTADPATGAWTTTPDGFWTGGFWVGELWLAGHVLDDPAIAGAAWQWCDRLSPRIRSRTVFRGFLFYYGAALGSLLAGDPRATALALAAAHALAGDFDRRAGLIPLGAEAEEAHTVGASETNIDGLVASPLLLWAARESGEDWLREAALAHAATNAAIHIREDGSVIQSASLDPETGKPLRRYTHKGVSDTSTWTRAQAWAMQFFTLAHLYAPEDSSLAGHAERVADWWIDHVPEDFVAYWDFDAPAASAPPRDTSGTAIAASAILKLAGTIADRDKAERYRRFAADTLAALVRRHLTPVSADDRRPPGILADGCFDMRNGIALADELIWGSYYLLEGLAMLSGHLPVGRM